MAATNINRVVITGNLTRDPELRSLNSGTSVCSLRIASNTRRKDNASGEWVDKPNYFDVTVWGAQGENVAKYCSKGRPVAIDGRLEWREWDDKETGQKRSAVRDRRRVRAVPRRSRRRERRRQRRCPLLAAERRAGRHRRLRPGGCSCRRRGLLQRRRQLLRWRWRRPAGRRHPVLAVTAGRGRRRHAAATTLRSPGVRTNSADRLYRVNSGRNAAAPANARAHRRYTCQL